MSEIRVGFETDEDDRKSVACNLCNRDDGTLVDFGDGAGIHHERCVEAAQYFSQQNKLEASFGGPAPAAFAEAAGDAIRRNTASTGAGIDEFVNDLWRSVARTVRNHVEGHG